MLCRMNTVNILYAHNLYNLYVYKNISGKWIASTK